MNRKTNLIPALLLSALSLYAMEDVKVTQFQHAGPFTVNKPILADSLNVNGGKESIKSDLTVRANACERHGTRR